MKEKLELKHLAPYLPYGLQAYGASDIWNITGLNQTKLTIKNAVHAQLLLIDDFSVDYDVILRPLSDLTKIINVNGEGFVSLVKLTKLSGIVSPCDFDRLYTKTYNDDPDYIECYENTASPEDHLCIAINIPDILKCEYWMINKLFEWHFDIFNLIPSGLAIDINTIK